MKYVHSKQRVCLLPLPLPPSRENRHNIHKRQADIYTGYHLLENYDIHYVHASYHYSQLVDIEVDQVSHNRLEIEYSCTLYLYKVDNSGVRNLF